jgi:hypothetical protein
MIELWDELARRGRRIRALLHAALWPNLYAAGYRDGHRSEHKSRERAYGLGYRHGKKDARALKVVTSNPQPAGLYTARHERAS